MNRFYVHYAVLEFIVKYRVITHFIARYGMKFSTAFRLVNQNGLVSPDSRPYFTPGTQEEWDYGELSECQAEHLALQRIFQPPEKEPYGISGRSGLYMEQVRRASHNPDGCSDLDRMFWEEHQMIGAGRYKRFRRLQPVHRVMKPMHYRMEFWVDKIKCNLEQGRRLADSLESMRFRWKEAWEMKDQLIEDPEKAITYLEVICSELSLVSEERSIWQEGIEELIEKEDYHGKDEEWQQERSNG